MNASRLRLSGKKTPAAAEAGEEMPRQTKENWTVLYRRQNRILARKAGNFAAILLQCLKQPSTVPDLTLELARRAGIAELDRQAPSTALPVA